MKKVFIICFLIGVLCGCSDITSESVTVDSNKQDVSLNIQLPENQTSRAVVLYTQVETAYYWVIVSGNNFYKKMVGYPGDFISIKIFNTGVYNISVQAFNSDDIEIAKGTATREITEEAMLSLHQVLIQVKVKPNIKSTELDLVFDIIWDDSDYIAVVTTTTSSTTTTTVPLGVSTEPKLGDYWSPTSGFMRIPDDTCVGIVVTDPQYTFANISTNQTTHIMCGKLGILMRRKYNDQSYSSPWQNRTLPDYTESAYASHPRFVWWQVNYEYWTDYCNGNRSIYIYDDNSYAFMPLE